MYGTTSSTSRSRPPLPPPHGGGSVSDSSSSCDDFNHPFQAFRPSLFVSLQSPADGEPSGSEIPPQNNNHNDTLPSLNDQSWIGARMSPIEKDDDDDDDEDRRDGTLPQHLNQQQKKEPVPPFLSASFPAPSAGHQRQEYPPFGIHPLQANNNNISTNPSNPYNYHRTGQQHQQYNNKQYRNRWKLLLGTWGAIVGMVSGTSLLGMGIYDAYVGRIDGYTGHNAWLLPWGQPSYEARVLGGGLLPNLALQQQQEEYESSSSFFGKSYWRFITSGLQCNSIVEWILVVFGWFVCARPSFLHPLSTPVVGSIYTICTLTGQSWLLAVWWLTQGGGSNVNDSSSFNDNNNQEAAANAQQQQQLVAHCAAWGTCGVLCFVGMHRPSRRFGCFMICIGLVVLTLLQNLWWNNSSAGTGIVAPVQRKNPLPLVAGCTSSAFVGWFLYGSQLLININVVGGNNNKMMNHQHYYRQQLPMSAVVRGGHRPPPPPPQIIDGSVRIMCTIFVMTLWMIPLLILAYFDHFYFAHGTSSSGADDDKVM